MRSFFVFVWYELCKSLRQQKVEARCKIRATFLHFISKPDGPSRLISSSLHCFGYHLCYLHHETSRSRECLFLFASRDSLWSRFNLEAVGRRKRTDPPRPPCIWSPFLSYHVLFKFISERLPFMCDHSTPVIADDLKSPPAPAFCRHIKR